MVRWVRRGCAAGEGGQAATEFLGVFVVIVAVILAIVFANPNAAEVARSGSNETVCDIVNDGCDGSLPGGGGTGSPGSPANPARGGEPDGPSGDAPDEPGGEVDSDGDGIPDADDPDADGDGVPDEAGADEAGPDDQRNDSTPAEFLWQFGEGFGAQLWDELKGIGETLAWLWDLATDPQTRADLKALLDAFRQDPIGFVKMLLQGLWEPIQAELDAGRDGAAVGRTVAMILAAVFGGKGLNKIKHLPEVQRFLSNLDPTGRLDPEELIRRRIACAPNSFTAGTGVLLADGSVLPIAQVEVGDLVLAADPVTGEVGARPVTDLIVGSGSKELVDVTVAGATVTATGGHPFWLPDTGQWVDADDLEPGDDLLTATGAQVRITAVAERTENVTVHNLTVADLHTYHALAGPTALLTHNADCTPEDVAAGPRGGRQYTPEEQRLYATPADELTGAARQVRGRFPDTAAPGETLVRRGPDGAVTYYQVYGPDGLPLKRVDLVGKPHGGIETPHIVEYERHVNPRTGEENVRRGQTRAAEPWEIPPPP